ncbi:MAG: GrpB family protein [Candidatus Komeilibacteria bacterium]|nr:GrpB family protein [Candidatus Komeilibacteria bacterium]
MNGIQNFSPVWFKKYDAEAEKIRSVLRDKVKDIQHIGSTAIPGMIAKPIIDMAVLTDEIDDIDYFVERLKPLGYTYKPDMSSAERIFFRKGDPVEYHLSIACPEHEFWNRQIIFRDYLIAHPEFIQEYNSLKEKNLAATPAEDLDDLSRSKVYNQGKTDFVRKILELYIAEHTLNCYYG